MSIASDRLAWSFSDFGGAFSRQIGPLAHWFEIGLARQYRAVLREIEAAGGRLVPSALPGIDRVLRRRESFGAETRHAALARQVDRWAKAQLSPEERRHIDAARARAVDALSAPGFRPVREELRSVAGLPDEAARSALAVAARTVLLAGANG